MSRFFMPGLKKYPGDVFTLDADNARHAAVLRLKPGDCITVCDGCGIDYACAITKITKSATELAVNGVFPNENEPGAKVCLFLSLMKSDKLEWAAQKAVELGVYAIYPFQSENSVARINDNAKHARLRKIAEEAAKQSGRGIIPRVSQPLTFGEALGAAAAFAPDVSLVAHEKSDIALKERLRVCSRPAGRLVIFVGPEGGFSDAEAQVFEDSGILPFSLGKLVLRAETACLSALSCVLYELTP